MHVRTHAHVHTYINTRDRPNVFFFLASTWKNTRRKLTLSAFKVLHICAERMKVFSCFFRGFYSYGTLRYIPNWQYLLFQRFVKAANIMPDITGTDTITHYQREQVFHAVVRGNLLKSASNHGEPNTYVTSSCCFYTTAKPADSFLVFQLEIASTRFCYGLCTGN